MPLEIYLSEGPNVKGLSKERVSLYVGYCCRGDDLVWRIIEGKK